MLADKMLGYQNHNIAVNTTQNNFWHSWVLSEYQYYFVMQQICEGVGAFMLVKNSLLLGCLTVVSRIDA